MTSSHRATGPTTGPATDPARGSPTTSAPAERTPEQLRADLGALRSELGDTVEELARRADVPTRLRATRAESVQRVRARMAEARSALAEKAPEVQSALRDRPAAAWLAIALGFLLVTSILRRRRTTGRDEG